MPTAGNIRTDTPVWPPFLRPGDVIGLFSPAGPVKDRQAVATGIRILHEMGFRTLSLRPLARGKGFLAGTDRQRIRELHALWARKEVKALLAVRGGYGCLRLLPHLDLQLFVRHPKMLIGFSDVTALLNAVSQQTGLVTVHGPVLTSLKHCSESSLQALFSLLTGTISANRPAGLEMLRPGSASGMLVGGNLTTLVHLLATPWEVRAEGSILLLEDTAEPLYRLDRMLTQLAACGVFSRISGLVLGSFDPGYDDPLKTQRLQQMIWDRALELTTPSSIPVWANYPIGHLSENHAVPLGVRATMNGMTGTLDVSG